jgi:hypothetical protein
MEPEQLIMNGMQEAMQGLSRKKPEKVDIFN